MTRSEQAALRQVFAEDLAALTDELIERADDSLSAEEILRCVYETFDLLAGRAKITGFLMTLTRRFATQRLVDRAKARGHSWLTAPHVLFLCVHNAGRSQLAAALMAHHGRGRVITRSAGSHPADELPAAVVDVLQERAVPVVEAFPKPITDDVLRAADVVVSLGCGDICTIYPGKLYLEWDVRDPLDQPLPVVRRICDELDARVRDLLDSLLR